MTFKRFFWLVRNPNAPKKTNFSWVNMWLGSSLTYNLCIFLIPKTLKFWPKILKQGCIDNRLILPLLQKFYLQRWLKWNDRYFRIRKRNHLTQTHTHTYTHTHTDLHTQFRFSCRLWGAPSTVHVWIWFPSCFVMSVVMSCTINISVIFKF